jgi:hypothetical protein
MHRITAGLAMLLGASGCHQDPTSADASAPDAAADAAMQLHDLAIADLSSAADLAPLPDLAAALCALSDGGVPQNDGGTPTLADLARLCSLASSCSGDLNASQCADDLIHAWPQDPVAARLVSCIGSSDCPSLYACFGGTLLGTTSKAPPSAWCDGTSVVATNGHRFDCCSLGLTCVRNSVYDDLTYCANPCPSTMSSATCSGNILLVCSDGVLGSTDCAGFDGVCQNGQCIGTGGPCDPMNDKSSCNGTIATICLNGHWQSHDCNDGSFRTTCDNGHCWPPPVQNAECLTGAVECDGDQLKVCVNAAFTEVDCHALGFAGCGPAPADLYATCQ